MGLFKTLYTYPYKKSGIDEEEYNFFGVLNSIYRNWKINFLSQIELMINELKPYFSEQDIKKGLLNNPFSFKSELDFAYFCVTNNVKIIESEPQLNSGKKLDLSIELDSSEVLIEVITPRRKADMVKRNCGFFQISGKTEDNLFSEFEHHEIKSNSISKPFIIAIDPIYAGIDEIGISCSIEEFQKKYPDLSPFLFGIILMRPKRYNVLTSEEIGGYQFFKNSSSKFDLNVTGLFKN